MNFNNFKNIFYYENAALNYLYEDNFFWNNKICNCGAICTININLKIYRCSKNDYRKNYTLFENTFFLKKN